MNMPRRLLFPAATVFLLLVGALLYCGAEGFWITDGGNKFMMLVHFLRDGDFAMESPFQSLDPENLFFPDGVFHFQRLNGRIYSVFTEFFPFISAPFFRFFGYPGLLILPVSGALLTLLAFAALLRRLRFPPSLFWLLPLTLAATPLCFYAVEFWEMTLFSALALGGAVLLMRRMYWGAGLLLAGGLWLREEFYVIIFALLLAAFWVSGDWRGLLRTALCCLIGALGLWAYQYFHYGHILGIHGGRYYSHNAVPGAEPWYMRLENYWIYLVRFQAGAMEWKLYYAFLYAPTLALIIAGGFRKRPHWLDLALLVAQCIASAALLLLLWRNPFGAINVVLLTGLLPLLPVAAGFWLNWRNLLFSRRPEWRFLAASVFLYLLIMPPILTRGDIGVIWGARHFLWLMPVLVAGSFLCLRRFRFLFGVLAALSIGMELYGIVLLGNVKRESVALTGELFKRSEHADVILTDAFFLPEMTPELFFARPVWFVRDGNALRMAFERLQEIHKRDVILVVSRTHSRLTPADLRDCGAFFRFKSPPELLKSSAASFLSVAVAPLEIQQSIK